MITDHQAMGIGQSELWDEEVRWSHVWANWKEPFSGAQERKAGSGYNERRKFSPRTRLPHDPTFLSDPLKGPLFSISLS
jgi:hypothetical protein